jgi:hypothetical protein
MSPARAACRPACRRRAELLQMQVGDAGFVERSRKLALGKARPARGSNREGIDKKTDFRALERSEHGR